MEYKQFPDASRNYRIPIVFPSCIHFNQIYLPGFPRDLSSECAFSLRIQKHQLLHPLLRVRYLRRLQDKHQIVLHHHYKEQHRYNEAGH